MSGGSDIPTKGSTKDVQVKSKGQGDERGCGGTGRKEKKKKGGRMERFYGLFPMRRL